MTDFVHLHLHTEYSLLDGACRIGPLMERVKSLGQTAVAVTDHGVMYGVVDFYKAAKKAGLHPVIGCEVYVAPRTRFDKVYDLDSDSHHLVLLCENETGYRNLCKLVSRGFTEGFYVRPRVDRELLAQYTEGLIALSACLSGEIPKQLLNNDYEGARETALWYRDLFGQDNYFLEIQDHGIPGEREVTGGLVRLSEETGIPLVATNDAHYLTREDAYAQDVLICIQTGKTVDDTDRLRFSSQEIYVKSEEEMARLFEDYPEALANTGKIAARCRVDFEFGKHHLPRFALPEGWDSPLDYLKHLSEEGLAKRYPDMTEAIRARLDFEIAMIDRMGFVDYFLIVGDFIRFAKEKGVPVGPGRGSAAGSIVSYCLGITGVDPLRYGLYFERFLNPERISMPDIDIDFCYQRRGEVIDYVIGKYGADHVAQIVTFGTMAARAAIRDVGRALGYTYAEVDRIAKMVPFAVHMNLNYALEVSAELREAAEADERTKKLIDTALLLEGVPRHASTHAAGVVITAQPVDSYVPLATNDEAVVTQFPMGTLEELGLLKMDFLGLRTLTVLYDAEVMIRRRHPDFSMEDIPEDDTETFAMLCAGKTMGVFQMESGGMTNVTMGLKPQSIEDMSATVALFRPGPMESIPRFIDSKHHPEKVRYKHPLLEEILEVTYGCIVYQEQVLEILRKLGGFSLGKADVVRRAMSKKKMAELARERENFVHGNEAESIAGAVNNGVPEAVAQSIFDEIIDFANYAFNKAHAVAYAVIAYRTAYGKCHYPREYMAALLTSVLDSAYKVSEYIAECREMGIAVLPPDINESEGGFTINAGGDIRFGLLAVKNVGRGFVRALVREREENGPYTSFSSFCSRLSATGELNRRAVESLVHCGAADCLGEGRKPLITVYETLTQSLDQTRRHNVDGQVDLFGDTLDVKPKDTSEFSAKEKLALEKDTIGLYLSGHPMDAYREEVRRSGAVPMRRILGDFAQEGGSTVFSDNDKVTVAGIIAAVRTKTTRNNSLMAYVTLEDKTAAMELLVFSSAMTRGGAYLKENRAVVVKGKVSQREEKEPQILADEIRPLSDFEPLPDTQRAVEENKRLYVRVPSLSHPMANRLRPLFVMFPGTVTTIVYVEDQKQKLSAVSSAAPRLQEQLGEWFGADNVVYK